VVNDPAVVPADVGACASTDPPAAEKCTWGSPSAAIRAVLIGDSVAETYLGPLHDIALNSGGRLQVHSEAQQACYFIKDVIARQDQSLVDACDARKQRAVDYINATKPDVVFISHTYSGTKRISGTNHTLSPKEWADSLGNFVDAFRANVKKIVFLAPMPNNISISDCYGNRSNTPADCISKVSKNWTARAVAEQNLAKSIGAIWVDSRPWFCADAVHCPSFVGTTLTMHDDLHMTQAYGQNIEPVILESLTASGAL